MNASERQRRACLVAMIFGAGLAITPILGPLGPTLHYLGDFFAERPQSMRGPGLSFYLETLALMVCPIGLILFSISLIFYRRSGRRSLV